MHSLSWLDPDELVIRGVMGAGREFHFDTAAAISITFSALIDKNLSCQLSLLRPFLTKLQGISYGACLEKVYRLQQLERLV